MSNVIYAVAAVGALLAIVGWFWNPKKRKVERVLSSIALILSAIGAATAQYTTTALIIMGFTLVLLLVIFVLKSSFVAYVQFDHHVTQAHVLLDNIGKDELSEIAKKTLLSKGIAAVKTAQGLEDIARRGEDAKNLRGILEAAGTVSVALSADFRLCIDLLISLRRFFEFTGEFMEVADKVAVAARNGVQPHELRLALTALQKERAAGPPLKLDEFLAAIVTLRRKDQDLELSGAGLGAAINELLAPTTKVLEGATPPCDYITQMLDAVDILDGSNITLTTRSMELQTEITQRALNGERFLPVDDPLLLGMRDALLDSETALEAVLGTADSAKAPEDLVDVHNKLIASLRKQIEGTQRARRSVEECDFGGVSEGLESRGRGVDDMLLCARSLHTVARRRKSRRASLQG